MKLKQIELNNDELNFITRKLIKRVDESNNKKQTTQFYEVFSLANNEQIEFDIQAELELFPDFDEYDTDVNHQNMISRSSTFRITLFYDGEEVKFNSEKIEKDIEQYFEV